MGTGANFIRTVLQVERSVNGPLLVVQQSNFEATRRHIGTRKVIYSSADI